MHAFHNDEAGYLHRHERHPAGFVLNHFGGTNAAYNILHRADCPFLWRPKDEGSRSAVEKWCSSSEEELRQHARAVLGDVWKPCDTCFRNTP